LQKNTTEATTTRDGMLPFMLETLVVIPKDFSSLAIIVLLLAGLVQYRQGHISRPAVVGNAFLLWQIFYADWNDLPSLLQLYLNIGTIIAVVALASYLLKESLPSEFYTFCYLFYGSVSVLIVILWWTGMLSLLPTFLSVIIFLAVLWAFLRSLPGQSRRSRYR
jgi:uncharacterized membrane protein